MGISNRFQRRGDSAPRAGAVGPGRRTLISAAIALAAVGALTAAALAGGGPARAAGKPGLPTGQVTPEVTTPRSEEHTSELQSPA